MNKNIGVLCDNLSLLDEIYKHYPNNTYIVYYLTI